MFTVNMGQGYEAGREGFVGAASTMGFSQAEADRAFDAALRAQKEFHTRCGQTGDRLLAELRADRERIGIMVFRRPSNAYVREADKSISQAREPRAPRDPLRLAPVSRRAPGRRLRQLHALGGGAAHPQGCPHRACGTRTPRTRA